VKPLFIIQARMSSSRLPGKVLKEINNKSLVQRIIDSTKASSYSSKIYIATSTDKTDDVLVEHLKQQDVSIYRGSLENVFSRFYEITNKEQSNFDSVVRLTADCPLLDPKVIDLTIEDHYKKINYDYTSNGLSGSFPLGQGVEVVEINKFLDLKNKRLTNEDLEHVTRFIWKRPSIYNCNSVEYNHPTYQNCSQLRLTVDEIEDFNLIEKIIQNMSYDKKKPSLDDVVNFLYKNPKLIDINKHIKQKET